MSNTSSAALERFRNLVGVKFQLYNSLFTSLPFHRIEKTGILLSLFLSVCEDGFKKKQSPKQIIEDFFNKHTSSRSEEHTSELQSQSNLVCRLLLEKKKKSTIKSISY